MVYSVAKKQCVPCIDDFGEDTLSCNEYGALKCKDESMLAEKIS